MPWFKVDDKMHDHRKVRTAGISAMGLWVVAGSWSADNLTDGFVPASLATRWGRQVRTLATSLCVAGLWEAATKDGEPGWQFVDWSEYQPTRSDVEKERQEARERMAKARAAKRSSSGEVRANNDGSSGEVRITPTRPDPTIKEPVVEKEASDHVSNATDNVHNIQDEPRSAPVNLSVMKIVRSYTSKVNPSNATAIAGHITNATQTWDLDTIAKAVAKMAAEGRHLGADSLRIELNQIGPDKNGIQRFQDGTSVDWHTGYVTSKSGVCIGGGGYWSGKQQWSEG